MDSRDKIRVLDFGGQYAHLIANRIRRLGVYADILAPDAPASAAEECRGLVFSGGPHSVYDASAPAFNPGLLAAGKPVLGLCYGHQLICHTLGGKVSPGKTREFGPARMKMTEPSPLFIGLGPVETVWMSHGDGVDTLPPGFRAIGATLDCPFAAVEHPGKKIFGLQFHAEVTHTPNGSRILENFLTVCGCRRDWSVKAYLSRISGEIETRAAGKNVFLLVSGGVDSTVAFALLNRTLGEKRVLGLHIDNGLMRKNETAAVEGYLREHRFHNLVVKDASALFLSRLNGVSDPEKKRRIIGDTFIDVQREALDAQKFDPEKWLLGQGTIYPDTIESGGTAHAALIKTHHNRVPAIEEMIRNGSVIEPLADLYKDEVRELGETLGIPRGLLWRHPFPGPGLGVRALCSDGKSGGLAASDLEKIQGIAREAGFSAFALPLKSVGVQGDFRTYAHPVVLQGPKDWDRIGAAATRITNEVRAVNRAVYLLAAKSGGFPLHEGFLTKERLDLLREADAMCTAFLEEEGLYGKVWQMPVVLAPLGKGNNESVILRPVHSNEAMTASFFPIPFDRLAAVTAKLMALPGVEGVFYDVTHKPPGTIEWE